ncbi:hypothetical protein VCHC72A2_00640A, partial [Vibrio cholerae HC-72A2]
MPLPLLGG